ncbi:MAG: hypothetical protein ACLTYW_00660 [Collinsella sp.]
MFAGAFIAFGGLFFTVFLSDSTLGWGAQRVVGGLCFCLGLVLCWLRRRAVYRHFDYGLRAQELKDLSGSDAQGLGRRVGWQFCRCSVHRLFGVHGRHI